MPDNPSQEDTPSAVKDEEPSSADAPAAEEPSPADAPAAEEPPSGDAPAAEEPPPADAPAAEEPVSFTVQVSKAAEGGGEDGGAKKTQELGLSLSLRSVAGESAQALMVTGIVADGIVSAWNAASASPRRVRVGDRVTRVNGTAADPMAMIKELRAAQELSILILRKDIKNGVATVSSASQPAAAQAGATAAAAGVGGARAPAAPAAAAQAPHAAPATSPPTLDAGAGAPAWEAGAAGIGNEDLEGLAFNADLDRKVQATGALMPLGINVLYSTKCPTLTVSQVQDAGAVPEWNKRNGVNYRIQCGDRIVSVNGLSSDSLLMLKELRESANLKLAVRRPGKWESAKLEKTVNDLPDEAFAVLLCAAVQRRKVLKGLIFGDDQ
eukprot:TRINITY_DN2778_c0_g1_i1.p1 TRINITY_DN2778_c0_g1~~TRINITY_DN2778_c0_g1_i1.p1  ORF type:complete len:382 (+),score=119.49 TRINITY_DN2778_c0_g1_i1:96-1241(+)